MPFTKRSVNTFYGKVGGGWDEMTRTHLCLLKHRFELGESLYSNPNLFGVRDALAEGVNRCTSKFKI